MSDYIRDELYKLFQQAYDAWADKPRPKDTRQLLIMLGPEDREYIDKNGSFRTPEWIAYIKARDAYLKFMRESLH